MNINIKHTVSIHLINNIDKNFYTNIYLWYLSTYTPDYLSVSSLFCSAFFVWLFASRFQFSFACKGV